ncbi:Bromodomain [Macleaya cordata]|uniref:Bromodomain n=1 Tax=Macleaya cordata TaxID=56857 RepID=A0A200R754_MACCD|nr:Bromodomain [Macleaya cordata]
MDSSSSTSDAKPAESRVVLFGIDLNEIPSSSSSETLPTPALDAYEVVRSVHGDPRRPFRPPVDLPGDVRGVPCVCGRSEARGGVVVCDGCERWFHLSCAGMRSRQAIILEDWICGGCLANGVRSKRWPLGAVSTAPKRTGVRLLDINASPPSDGEGEGSEEVQHSRMHTSGETYCSGFPYGASMTYPTLWYPGGGFDVQRESGIMAHPVKLGSERIVNHGLTISRSPEEADLNSTLARRFRSTNTYTSLRRKELARLSRTNSSIENQEALRNSRSGDFSSDVEILEPHASSLGSSVRVTEAGHEGNGGCESHQNDGLPIQYEDLFLLCSGKVDSRPSYHNSSQIWPVGYRSSWHDKVTGSLFTCDVLDGGISGPIFKVRRCPCSTSVIPNGSTVLLRQTLGRSDVEDKVESEAAIFPDMGYADETNIQMILSDPCPLEQDLISCFGGSTLSEACNYQTKDVLTPQASCLSERSGDPLPNNFGLKDEIGEFFTEGRSSSLVWGKVSEMLVGACHEAYKQSGSLQFYCTHELDSMHSSCSDFAASKNKDSVGSLAKFCSLSGPRDIPRVIRSYNELEMSCKALKNWLNQDRFGLDMEFVQEIIEQLPGCHTCSEYEFLTKRSDYSTLVIVGNGLLHAKRKSEVQGKEEEEAVDGLFKRCKKLRKQDQVQDPEMKELCHPPGKPLSLKLPAELIGDVLQVWELLWRFNDVLGLKEPLLFEELEGEVINPWFYGSNFLDKIEKESQENRDQALHRSHGVIGHNLSRSGEPDLTLLGENSPKFIKVETVSVKEAAQDKLASNTYYRCTGVALTMAHSSLLKVLVGELQAKVAAFVDPNFDGGESKSRRGRKKDADNLTPTKKSKIDMLPINELTWPELARRYILSFLCMDGNLDSSEVTSREGIKVFRCLQGDGGMLCGSLTGVGGMEADALLLAEATKQIFGSLNRENDVWSMEYKDSDAVGASETTTVDGNTVPGWAQVLEPVRKLPTNVGTRIRKCVYEALEKGPPEWAKKILEHSISKEVYKGNASGPTKKAVLSVLASVCGEASQQKPDKRRKGKSVKTVSDIIMKQCRYVLRHAIGADEAKTFCNLLGTTSLNPNDNEDEGILGSPAMVSRPLDFRTIDLRLAVGAYGGSHEAFLEDVREVWHNIHTAYGDRPDLMHLAETLSENFESLYEKEVLTFVQKIREHADPQCLNAAVKKELNELVCGKEIPKAPWDEGVCKLCGIDKDDESVLLCDTCDSEYHTYCLNPPLARIPEGNWYCPSCVASQGKTQDASKRTQVTSHRRRKRYQGEGTRVFSEALSQLAAAMEEKEYWECSLEERVFLLKFLCDEVLNSAIVREHLDQCADMSADLQQKLRSLSVELRNLKFKEEVLAKESTIMLNGVGEAGKEGMATMLVNHGRGTGQRQILSTKYNYCTAFSGNLLHLDDVPEENELNNLNKNPSWSFVKSISEDHCNGGTTQSVKLVDTEDQRKEVLSVMDDNLVLENHFPPTVSMKSDESNKHNELPLPTPQQKQVDDSGRDLTMKSTLNSKHDFGIETNDCVQPNFKVLNESQAYNLEADSLKNDILRMQDSISGIESQLLKLSMRRDFLGRDTAGRLYWALSRPGKCPWLVVDGSIPMQEKRSKMKEHGYPFVGGSTSTYLSPPKAYNATSSTYGYESHDGVLGFSSWVSYDSDVEIQELVGWLSSSDPRERELKDSILQMQRMRFQDSQQAGNLSNVDCQVTGSRSFNGDKGIPPVSLVTKALTQLERKYGPCLEAETTDIIPKKRGRKSKVAQEEKLYRCECLEPVWPSRHHCLSCHQTFCTNVELEGHNDGKCNSLPPAHDESKETDDHSKGKGKIRSEISREEYTDEMNIVDASKSGKLDISSRVIKFQKKEMVCPYNIEEISRKFITKNSNKELVKEIGLIGSDGIPTLVPSTSPYIHDPTLILDPAYINEAGKGVGPTAEVVSPQKSRVAANLAFDNNPNDSSKRCATGGMNEEALRAKGPISECMNKKDPVSLNKKSPELEVGHCCVVPEASLRPLVGKVSQILRRLKTNLLDMDAALPEEALRPSKAHPSKRSAWRAFVKSAESIFEMVQATIVFENMIKTEYLRNSWWYWSSLSAAAKTSTISSLALRIYTLDATIVYEKTPPGSDTSHPADNPKLGKKRKDTEG